MQKIRAALEKLSEPERKRLMYAFENLMPELIVFTDGNFVGCNLKFLENLEVVESHGPWMTGRKKK